MRRKTFVTRVLACALTASMLLAGCGSAGGNGNEAGSASASSEGTESADGGVTTISVAVQMNEKGEYSSDNYAINWIEEQMNIKFDFVALPSDEGDAETKLNLMLSSGDYPDVICFNLNKQKMVNFGKEGIFIPINDLYEQYGDNMKRLFELRPQYEQNAYAPDGNMYGFPTANECYHCQAYPKLWYNTEWLESLGLTEPTTTEELKEVLLAVKNSDYNGNGEADEIPLTGSPDWDCQVEWWLMNSFIPCDKDTLSYAKDGQVIFACNTEEFKEGLAYMNDLFNNGLLDPTMFSQTSDQMQQVIRADENRVFAYAADHYGMGVNNEDRHMNEIMAAMVPVEGSTGARYQLHDDYVDMTEGFNWFITDNCENPEIAFQVGDFLMGDECSMIQMYGEEGKWWGKLDTPTESILEGTDAIYWVDSSTFTSDSNDEYNKNTWWTGLMNQLAEFRASMSPRPEDLYTPTAYEARLFDETSKVVDYFYPEYLPKNIFLEDEDEADTFATLQTSLQEYVKTSMAQFITGELSLENDWDSYVSTLDGYGVDNYVELYQKAYDVYYSAGDAS
ncbi:MAG TPA: extracellular solute-binding protein [Candidatus Eisenbergiella merdavium]|uniref:Extracellular solute-binding protein n=1 Tax=Candidatus Eisenbergiella merdavium TaxID=2838551 RepID=A0A9D2NHS9_9FIRM|nr:extracellular solute-binding protein [Candidatus Eisenbergiella merdavium]